jgi:hypothetical protein
MTPSSHALAALLLCVFIFSLSEIALRLPLPPAAPPPQAAARPLKRAALVYFGTVGATSYDLKEVMLSSAVPWSLDAATGARPYIERHVLAFNEAHGWTFDTFFHTWNAELEDALVALLGPVVSHSAGAQPLRGATVTSGMAFSADLALQLMRAHAAASGVRYERVAVLRFDSVFYRGLDLDALAEDDAFYVAAWCKADPERRLPARPGTVGCWATHTYWADEEGVPDFWFAGAPAPVLAVFERMGERMASGAITVGRTCNGCGHAQMWGAARASGAPLRRWGFHQIDNDLFRDSVCGSKWDDVFVGVRPWVNFSRGDASPGADSACEGGFLCAVEEGELERCAGFKHDPKPSWVKGL